MAHAGGSSCTDFTPVIVHDIARAVNRNEGISSRPHSDCSADRRARKSTPPLSCNRGPAADIERIVRDRLAGKNVVSAVRPNLAHVPAGPEAGDCDRRRIVWVVEDQTPLPDGSGSDPGNGAHGSAGAGGGKIPGRLRP